MSNDNRVLEAFDFTLRQISELKSNGIEVKIMESYSKKDEDAVDKYSTPGVLPAREWITVSFKVMSNRDLILIKKSESQIRQIYGINFDTGFGGGFRDWELDWSFSID
jgi:hypothetical protein